MTRFLKGHVFPYPLGALKPIVIQILIADACGDVELSFVADFYEWTASSSYLTALALTYHFRIRDRRSLRWIRSTK